MTIEEIKDKALDLLLEAANGNDIERKSKELVDEYLSQIAKYKERQWVWVFTDDYKFVCANVKRVINGTKTSNRYELCDEGGEGLGSWPEEQVFATKKELAEHIIRICKNV